jgi:hypothetical protein
MLARHREVRAVAGEELMPSYDLLEGSKILFPSSCVSGGEHHQDDGFVVPDES